MLEYRQSIGHDISKVVGDEPGFLNRVYNGGYNAIGHLFNRRSTNSNEYFNGYKGTSRIGTVIGTCMLATLVAILAWVSIMEHGNFKRMEKALDAKLVKKIVDIYNSDKTQSLDPNEVQKLLEEFKSRGISNYSLEGFVEER